MLSEKLREHGVVGPTGADYAVLAQFLTEHKLQNSRGVISDWRPRPVVS
jgi:hypothetical protein